MKIITLLVGLCLAQVALAFEKSRPMVSNIYFVNDKLGAVVVVNNDNHSPDKWKSDPIFFMFSLLDFKSEKISKQMFISKFMQNNEMLSVFNELDFVFTKTPRRQKLNSRKGVTYIIERKKCKALSELEENCEEIEIVFNKNKEILKLPFDGRPNVVVTSIELFFDYLLIGTGSEAELELRPNGLFAFNLKTKTLIELPVFSHQYITLLKIDDNLSHIWVAGSLGVHKLDKDLKVVKACPLIFKEGKESEATISCNN